MYISPWLNTNSDQEISMDQKVQLQKVTFSASGCAGLCRPVQDDIKTLSDKVGEAKAKGAEKEEKPQDAVGEEEGPPAAQDCQLQPSRPKLNQPIE